MHRYHTKLSLRLSKVKIFLYALPDVMLRANVTTNEGRLSIIRPQILQVMKNPLKSGNRNIFVEETKDWSGVS